MCQKLAELADAMCAYGECFDADTLLMSDARRVVRFAARIENVAATVKALAAARCADDAAARRSGHRNAAEQLANETGIGVGDARRTVERGRRLAEQPEVAGPARRGELSAPQAEAISDAADVNPDAAKSLVETAKSGGSMADLKDQCGRAKAEVTDLEARRAAIHHRRRLRAWTDTDGEWHLHAAGNPEQGAQIMAAIEPIADEHFDTARREGTREHPDAYHFDALVDLAQRHTSPPVPGPAGTDVDADATNPPAPGPAGTDVDASATNPPPSGIRPGDAGAATPPSDDGAPDRAHGEATDIGNPTPTDRDDLGAVPSDEATIADISPGDGDAEHDAVRGDSRACHEVWGNLPVPAAGGGECPDHDEENSPAGTTQGALGLRLDLLPRPGTADRPAHPTAPPARYDDDAARPLRKPRAPAKPRKRTGAPVKLIVRVDLDTFLRGYPLPGETCELSGYGPISYSQLCDLINQGDPFITAVLTKAQRVEGVAHLGRHPNAWQKTALQWLYPTCAAQGCPATSRLQHDHRSDWSQTHFTLLDWLDSLCPHHHALKSQHNWALVPGIGKRPFVPPADPRHPAHRPPGKVNGTAPDGPDLTVTRFPRSRAPSQGTRPAGTVAPAPTGPSAGSASHAAPRPTGPSARTGAPRPAGPADRTDAPRPDDGAGASEP